MKRNTLAAAVLLAQFAAIADAAPATIAGAWSFQTAKFNGCVISGQMMIAPARNGRHECSFNAVQTCGGEKSGAQQTCTATRTGEQLTIKSKIKQCDSGFYKPDDFTLIIETSAYMKGGLFSEHPGYKDAPAVEFFRGDAPVS